MSKAIVETIEGPAGVPVILTGQAAAKYYCKMDVTYVAIQSFNTASITDTGTGRPQVNLTNAMAGADYPSNGSNNHSGSALAVFSDQGTAGSVSMITKNDSAVDTDYVCGIIGYGDLA